MARVFDWPGFRRMWIDYVEEAIRGEIRAKPLRAIAFFQGYAETDGKIDGYVVGADTLGEDGDEDADDGADELHTTRWSPDAWSHPELEADGKDNVRYYRALTELACSSSRAHWAATYERHEREMTAVARELAKRARSKAGVFADVSIAPDFVVFVHDTSRDGPAKARASIPSKLFAKLFPNTLAHQKERDRIAKLPLAKRIAYYIARLDQFDPPVSHEDAKRALIALGMKAVLPLTAALDTAHGTSAAQTLAAIGTPAAAFAAKALLRHAPEVSSRGAWSARALGALGRIDLLEPLARAEKTRHNAVLGLAEARPASYPLLETLLAETGATAEAITERLRPGSGSYAVKPRDFAAIAAAATSPQVVIRMDAACALDNHGLGEKNRALSVPILIAMLADGSAEVRRLAALSLGRLGQHARSGVK